jgi:hypothetical protein
MSNVNRLSGGSQIQQTQNVQSGGQPPPYKPTGPKPIDAGTVAITGRSGSTSYNSIPGSYVGSLGTGSSSGGYSRGYIEIAHTEPTRDGVKVWVKSHHQTQNDRIDFTLQARLRDGNKEQVIDLGKVAKNANMNPHSYEGQLVFEVKYKDINKYLKSINPSLEFKPGAPLAVVADWSIGHTWGGFNREGSFFTPAPIGSSASAQNAGTMATGGNVPLDIGVKYEEILTDRYPVLIKDGQFTSRVEYETKWEVEEKNFDTIRQQLDKLASDPKMLKKVLGPDWTLEPVSKYWKTDPKTGQKTLVPMQDTYYDDKDLTLAREQIALRFRAKEGDKMNILGVKPGPGVVDSQGIASRIEYGLQVENYAKNDPATLKPFLNSDNHLNPFRFIRPIIPNVDPMKVLQPAMDLTAYRYKYVLKHRDGTEIELSLDDVNAKSRVHKDAHGKPLTGRFFQFEMDLGHVQMGSNNIVNRGNGNVSTTAAYDEAEQRKFIAGVGSRATFGGAPRIHVPTDVGNKALMQNGAFSNHQHATAALQKMLFPQGVKPALQKFHVAGKVMGLIK